LREVDGNDHTVIMVQVENEIGMIPDSVTAAPARTNSSAGRYPRVDKLFAATQGRAQCRIPRRLGCTWFQVPRRWEEVFGKGPGTDEIFMAWHFGRYVNRVAELGKAEYPLPMFVNAALIRPGYQPGQYPSAGPLPHLMDVWRAGAPKIDFLSPDIYFTNFAEWVQRFHQSGNPLFIPENMPGPLNAVDALYAIASMTRSALAHSASSLWMR